MKYIEVVANQGSSATISAIAEQSRVRDFRVCEIDEDGLQRMRLLVADDKLQMTLDALQRLLTSEPRAHIVVLPVEILLPKPEANERREEDEATASREVLYENIEKNSQLNLNYILLIVLSTVVAAIGLIKNNIAVVIGAMVIAPLLGPNLSFNLGTALGDVTLMRKSVLTASVGLGCAIGLSVIIGLFWKFGVPGLELLSRTEVGLDSVALALASGAAAALSLTTGLSSVLVGVMVAVALLPPAATVGIMLGYGSVPHAVGAAQLLVINMVSINLASSMVFLIKGIRPRTAWEKQIANRRMGLYMLLWMACLVVLVVTMDTLPHGAFGQVFQNEIN